MACKECEERRRKLRDAIMHGKMAEAMGLTVGGLREMMGLNGAEPTSELDGAALSDAPAKTGAKAK